MAPSSLRKLDRKNYHVAWICAVADLELTPARLLLDQAHQPPDIDNQYDDNIYKFGAMAGHNVVMAACPEAMTGQVNVSSVAGPLSRTFPAIKMALLVGIGGGVPQKHLFSQPLKDVRLGDVVVGWPSYADGKPAVVYYDSGRSLVNGFQTTTQLNRPDEILLKALAILKSDNSLGESNFKTYLDRLQQHEELGDQFRHPGLEHDMLFESTYEHVGEYNSYCSGCNKANLVGRKARTESQKDKFIFHQGRIATGNSVVQDGLRRDSINEQLGNVFCIDMEAAGVDINKNCLVIRGISDYADSHKSDMWRPYAAGKAVVFARELLDKIPPADVKEKMASGNKHWLVDRSTNPQFTGRREVIDRIIKRITSEDAGNEQRRFVLTGMGGQGKSEVCLHVANEVRDRFWGIFWVDVSTRTSAEESFSEVAEALGCEKTVDAVRKTLSNLPPISQWLLILDNADDPKRDYRLYFPSGNRGAVLMTSRNSRCGVLATAGSHEELDSLGEPECIQLLHKTPSAASRPPHPGHFACWFLHGRHTHSSKSQYLEFLRTNRKRLLEKSRGQDKSRYDTVYATFGASVEFLESPETGSSEETRKDALQLLDVLSTFHYTSVPLDVLVDACEGAQEAVKFPKEFEMYSDAVTSWHVSRIPSFVRTDKGDAKLRITDAVRRLESLALVRTDRPGRAWKSVSMHPLVHVWAGDRQNQQERKRALRMTECIVALSDFATFGWRPYHPQFAPHLKRLVESDVELVGDAAACRHVLQVCVPIAWIYHHMDLYRDTYEFTSRIFQQLDLYDQKPTEEFRELYRVFAVAIDRDGSRPAQAVRAFEAIERLDKETRRENDRERLANMRDLGDAYRVNGQAKEAVALLRKVVNAQEERGAEDEDLLLAQHGLGSALIDDGQNKEAIMLLEKVVMTKQRLFSEDHPGRLASQQVLAAAYLEDGQIAEATPRLKELARIRARTLGAKHPSAATTQAWLADAYKQTGRLSKAITLYEQAVDARTLVLSQEHPDLLATQHDLASAYLDAGKAQEAIDILERVVKIRDFRLDKTDPSRLVSQHELARAYLKARRVVKAIEVLEQVVKVDSLMYDQDHPERVASEELLHEAYALRDGSYSSIKSAEELKSVQSDPVLQPVGESKQAGPSDAPTDKAQTQNVEPAGDSLEGVFSHSLVLSEKPTREGSLRARLSSVFSKASPHRLRKVKGEQASRNW